MGTKQIGEVKTLQIGEVKTFIFVDHDEIDNLMRELYPNFRIGKYKERYEFRCVQEASNGSAYEFDIDGKLSDYDRKEWEEREYMNNHLVLNKLCEDGYIDPGKYIVSVSW